MGDKTIRLSGFPENTTVKPVTRFLETYTGSGSVFAVKVRPLESTTRKRRKIAMVQFVTNRDAEIIYNLACQRQLYWYDKSYLTAKYAKRDIVPNPGKAFHVLEDVVLHLGCLISQDKFGVLWTCDTVKVHFGFFLSKMNFDSVTGPENTKLVLRN